MLEKAVPILASLNTDQTVKFYTEKLGFTFHSDWDGYLIFSREGVHLHSWTCQDPEIPKNTGCYINVTEVVKLCAEYQPQGVVHPQGALEVKPWNMKQFSILDNNGNILHFGEDIAD